MPWVLSPPCRTLTLYSPNSLPIQTLHTLLQGLYHLRVISLEISNCISDTLSSS